MQCVRTGREDHHATKPPCHRQQRECEIAGVSVAEHGGDKALVLCQPGSQGTSFSCFTRRRWGSPVYLGRVTPVSTVRTVPSACTAVKRGPRVRSRTAVWAKLPIRPAREERLRGGVSNVDIDGNNTI